MTFKIRTDKLKKMKKGLVIHWDDGKYYDTLCGMKKGCLIWKSGRIQGRYRDECEVIIFHGLTKVKEEKI